ncbi:MAG: ABC transporter permease [Pseudoclavibacter sp.]
MSSTESIATNAVLKESERQQASRRPLRDVLRALLMQPAGAIGSAIIVIFVALAVFAPLIVPYSPLATDTANVLTPPSAAHWLGTDEIGRDVLSRLIAATGPALLVGTVAVLMASVVGISLGVVAGYYRGVAESVIMRICDVIFAFPAILIGIFAVVVLGPGIVPVAMAVGIGSMPMFARLARAEVLKEMNRDYVKAARGMGATDLFIVVRHVLPNISTTMLVQAAAAISAAIVLAAALDFLGLGTQPPNPSWGSMLQTSRSYMAVAPVFAISPGLMITILVLGINIFAAGFTNALDPRLRTKLLSVRRAATLGMLFGGFGAKVASAEQEAADPVGGTK